MSRWFGVEVPEVHPAPRSGGTASTGEVELAAFTSSARWSQPTGDLDGDGRDDVYVVEFDLDEGTGALSARRGVDGAELWRRDATDLIDLAPVPIGDVITALRGEDLAALWELR